jgi:exodeoxyribonuclease-3
MRLATWNINSVRLRMPQLLRLIAEAEPDVICLQETKCPDEAFPHAPLEDAGYAHRSIHGMKGYNGVAILSRRPLEAAAIHHRVGRQDCRHIAAAVKISPRGKAVEIHCAYIPAGGDIPDPDANEKFAHKLAFVEELTRWWQDERSADMPMILCGDLNIAPLENDVWSHKQLLSVVSHTPIEVEKLTAMQNSIGFIDAVRTFVPPSQKLYTWWSYRNRDWKLSDRGRRLDHVWVTKPLKKHLKAAAVMREARDWELASDHVPVIVDFGT